MRKMLHALQLPQLPRAAVMAMLLQQRLLSL